MKPNELQFFFKPIFHVIVTDTQIFELTFTEIVLMWFLKQMKKKICDNFQSVYKLIW